MYVNVRCAVGFDITERTRVLLALVARRREERQQLVVPEVLEAGRADLRYTVLYCILYVLYCIVLYVLYCIVYSYADLVTANQQVQLAL